jgi:D-alanyl-D-alanine carboxypeptidase
MRRFAILAAARCAATMLLLWAGLVAGPMPATAAGERYAALVLDAGSGEVLFAHEANSRWFPASLTKMMTLYLTFAEIEAGRLALDDMLTTSRNAAAQPNTKLGLVEGEKISVERAITAVIVRSANDASVVLAERIAGTEGAFAARMTEQARALGMAATVYRNASGWPDGQQVTTAHDQAVLALALMKDFPQHYHFFGLSQMQDGNRSLGGYNGLLVSYPGADGLKTGFTCDSGYNIVASAKRGERRLVAVYLGAPSNGVRNARVAELLNEGFADSLENGGATMAALITPSEAPLPRQLGPDLCTPGGTGVASGRLPGWGVVFGAFPQKGKAQTVIKQMRGLLQKVMSSGNPMAIKRTQEGTTLYSALLVGLSQEQATKACKHLWDQGHYCLALRPEVLNNPQALWR